MKHIIFVTMLLATCPVWAQSMLNVRTADNEVINVAVDGRFFNKRGTSVTVGDLPPGKHRLEIYTVARYRGGRGIESLIYEGKVRTFEGMVTLFSYDPYTRMPDIQQQDINGFVAAHPPVQRGVMRNQHFQQQPDYSVQPGDNGRAQDDMNRNNADNGMAAPAPAAQSTLTDAAMDQLKTSVAAKKTDTEKEAALKDAVKNQQISTAQVGMMMDWLNFESSKADFAEWAYPLTTDKEAFGSLESKFTYKVYQDDLIKFLQGK